MLVFNWFLVALICIDSFFAISIASPSSVLPLSKKFKLSIQQALARGIKQNFDIKILQMESELRDKELETKKILLFSPKLSISSESTYKNTMQNAKYNSGDTDMLQRPSDEQKLKDTKSHRLALNLTELNLFNSWTDKNELEKSKLIALMANLEADQNIMSLMISIATFYYAHYFLQEKTKYLNAKNDLIATIIRINKKSSDLDALVLEQEKNSAEAELKNQEISYLESLINLNKVLNEETLIDFELTSNLSLKEMQIDFNNLLSNMKDFPEYQTILLDQQAKKIDFLQTKLDYLPKLSISLGETSSWGFNHENHETNELRTFSSNSSGPGNFDLSINLTWNLDIWGANGLFSNFNYQRGKISHQRAVFKSEAKKRNIYFQLVQLKQKIELQNNLINKNQSRANRSLKILQLQTQLLVNDRKVILTLKNYLDEYSDAYDDLIDSKMELFKSRSELATLTGLISYLAIDSYSGKIKLTSKINK